MKIWDKIFKPHNFWALITGIFLLLSLYCGLLGGLTNRALWLLFALLALSCIYKAFPNFWKYAFSLGAIYIFAGMGASLLTTGVIAFIAGGIVCEIIAIFVMHNFSRKIIARREKSGYSPLGLWFLALALFFIFTNLSLADWAWWVAERSGLALYTCSEIILILLAIYILWLPELRFKRINICSFCNASIKWESLPCPSCGSEKELAYCSKGEHWLVECKFCRALTIYGKERCKLCKRRLDKKLTCSKCGKAYSLTDWKRSISS